MTCDWACFAPPWRRILVADVHLLQTDVIERPDLQNAQKISFVLCHSGIYEVVAEKEKNTAVGETLRA